jgi:hypothetical protein
LPTYAQLNQLHPSCDPARSEILAALYEGGARLDKLKTTLLPQRPREREQHYQTRLREAEYRNYLGPIIDYFKSMLFASRPVLKATVGKADEPTTDAGDYWTALREDCDGGGTDFDTFFAQILTDAMIERTGWLRLHVPDDGGPAPEDASAFAARGLGNVWLEHVPPGCLRDWEEDATGRLLWAMVHRIESKRLGIADSRANLTETWDYLTPETIETYSITYPKDKRPKPDDEIPRVGAPVANRFRAVPLVCLDLPPALWIASRLQSPQLALFRKVSALAWSLSATAYAMPVVMVESPTDYAQQTAGPGYEIVIGKDEKYAWEAPPTGHFDALDREVKASKDEIFRIAHQMAMGVDNNAAAVGRTAESKASDIEITRVVLTAFSRAVKETMERTLDMVTIARGEDMEWSVEGLDDFASFDIGAYLTQLGLVDKAGGIPSKTFQIHAKTRAAEALLKDVDEATKATIRKEIADGTPDPVDQAEQIQQALAGLGAGGAAQRPGAGAPGGQIPPAGDSRRAAGREVVASGKPGA